jgi:polygalacturonase
MTRLLLTFKLTSVVVAGAFGVSAYGATPANAVNPEAVKEVKSGARTEANAAWWGFDREDSTQFLQDAIDSGAKRVVVPYMGAPWIVTPIALRGDLELAFEPGVVVLAKAGEFKGKADCLFKAVNVNDVTVRGYGATLRMRKTDYQTDAYERAEWRMALDFMGCRRVRVEGLRLESSGGDGIYIGCTKELPYCSDVVIRDVICDDHHRQGISVIGAENLLIENCVLSNTRGTAPQAGIDLEPNKPTERLVNCVIRNCVIESNAGAGILVYLKPLSRETEPVSILFENCHVRSGGNCGVAVGAVGDDGPKGTIEFRNCMFENTKKTGAYIYDKSADSALVRFENCNWRNVWCDDPGKPGRARVPILLHVRRTEVAKGIGGVEFVGCHVFDEVDRPVVLLDKHNREHGVSDVTGFITVHNPHGARLDLGDKAVNVTLEVLDGTR